MRLYLSSFRLGSYPEKLVEFTRNRPIAIISNALDFIPEDERRKYEANVYSPKKEFAALGVEAHDTDLRHFFGNRGDLRSHLEQFGLVWLLGGNAFLLMRAIRQSGFPSVIRELLTLDRIAYGGFSAGAVVATPNLRGIELMDDPAQLAEGYESEVCWDGLGLVDFSIVPHFRSDHPEAEAAETAVSYMKQNGLGYKALADGEVIISEGGVNKLLSKISG